MRWLLTLLLFLLLAPQLRVSAQGWSASVVDAESGQPISYASIGVLGGAQGTVADEDGNFILQMDAARGDSVRVSAMGYRSCTYSLLTPLPARITLLAEPITTGVVEVRSTALGRLKKLGVAKRPDNVTFFFQSNQLGTELGSVISLPGGHKDYFVKAVNFYVIRNNYGRVKFRLHIYRFNGTTDALSDLLSQSVYLTSEATSGWVRVDLTDMDIVLRGERHVLVSLEWLEDTNPKRSAADLQFGAVLAPTGSIYYRRAVESEWEYLSKRYYGLRAKLGMYFEVYELKD